MTFSGCDGWDIIHESFPSGGHMHCTINFHNFIVYSPVYLLIQYFAKYAHAKNLSFCYLILLKTCFRILLQSFEKTIVLSISAMKYNVIKNKGKAILAFEVQKEFVFLLVAQICFAFQNLCKWFGFLYLFYYTIIDPSLC